MNLANKELIVLGLAAVAVYLIFTNKDKALQFARRVEVMTKEVLNPSGGAFDNGWRYFDDGTSIDPQGRYWKGGQVIWSPIT